MVNGFYLYYILKKPLSFSNAETVTLNDAPHRTSLLLCSFLEDTDSSNLLSF